VEDALKFISTMNQWKNDEKHWNYWNKTF
jgi:hypothetical protein